MKATDFLDALDHARVTTAIAEAERGTSGHIRVFVSHRAHEDALKAAHARFHKLGMNKTVLRNAVLIYFAPKARKYAVVGDQGIHEKGGGDAFWQAVVDSTMAPLLKEARYTDAIVAGVEAIGRELAEHFPKIAGAAPEDPVDPVEEG